MESDNWIVQNLQSALNTWNDKLNEIWTLLTQDPQSFKGGASEAHLCENTLEDYFKKITGGEGIA